MMLDTDKVKEIKACKECGSENVRLLAWLEWNVDVQGWRLSVDGGEEDRFWCIDCDADIEIVTRVKLPLHYGTRVEWDYGLKKYVVMHGERHIEEGHMLYEGHIVYKIIPLTNADLQSIYRSYRHWIDDLEQEEDWWAGHGYDKDDLDTDGRAFTFDINFVSGSIYHGYDEDDDTDELPDPNDFGIWLYPLVVDAREGQHRCFPCEMPLVGIDVTDEFKAYLERGK